MVGTQVSGKRLGIVGLGRVGRVTAQRAHVWGELAPPPPGPPGPLAPDNIRAGALRSGNIRRSLAGGTIVAPLSNVNPTAALRSGNIRGRGGPA